MVENKHALREAAALLFVPAFYLMNLFVAKAEHMTEKIVVHFDHLVFGITGFLSSFLAFKKKIVCGGMVLKSRTYR